MSQCIPSSPQKCSSILKCSSSESSFVKFDFLTTMVCLSKTPVNRFRSLYPYRGSNAIIIDIGTKLRRSYRYAFYAPLFYLYI